MHSDHQSKVLHQLQRALCSAPLGEMHQVERHICRAMELLDEATALPGAIVSLRVARSYMEDAYAAFLGSDSLGVVLPLYAALQTIQQEPQNKAGDRLHIGNRKRSEAATASVPDSARSDHQAVGHLSAMLQVPGRPR
jgi:hypothetical protein